MATKTQCPEQRPECAHISRHRVRFTNLPATERLSSPSAALGFVRPFSWSTAQASAGTEDPIRAEIFSAERLEQHARSLAAAQATSLEPRIDARLAQRFKINVLVLRASYRVISEAVRAERAITPAAEWSLDNCQVLDEPIAGIEEQLPQIGREHLPRLSAGFLEGFPRLYGLVWAFVAHTESNRNPELLIRFLNA